MSRREIVGLDAMGADVIPLVVLDDGATYGYAHGAAVVFVTRAELIRLDRDGGDARDLRPVCRIDLRHLYPTEREIDV